MNSELITIGDELLIGQVIDTNSAFIAQRLNEIGIRVIRRTAVGDIPDDILGAIADASMRASVIIITGGLGPTKDDMTKQVLCDYFGTKLRFDEGSFHDIQELFRTRGKEITELNRSQAELPGSCIPLSNKMGTAPGMWFEHNDKIYVSLPGVPYEMEYLMKEHVIPKLKQKFHLDSVFHLTILTTGLAESVLADKIKDWENALPSCFKLAYLPSPGMVRLRLTSGGLPYKELESQAWSAVQELKKIIGNNIFGYGDEKLQEVVGKILAEKELTIAVAESCTGGYLSHLFTSVPGSSAYFSGGVIAYDNRIKMEELSVDSAILEKYGAVSEETVIAMATNVRAKLGTDYSISVSGIAGPSGGSDEKPVGLVWIALAGKKGVKARKFQFGKNRILNITLAANSALEMLRRALTGVESI